MIGYLDLPSGLSGDMFLGCLVDAGWPIDQLRFTIAKLKLPEECTVEQRAVMKGPLRATLRVRSMAERVARKVCLSAPLDRCRYQSHQA